MEDKKSRRLIVATQDDAKNDFLESIFDEAAEKRGLSRSAFDQQFLEALDMLRKKEPSSSSDLKDLREKLQENGIDLDSLMKEIAPKLQ